MSCWSYVRGDNRLGADVVEVDEARLRALLSYVLQTIDVDEEYYLGRNADVAAEVKSGRLASGKQHYILSGYYEDRFPHAIEVDETWYLAQYGDVRDAVINGHFVSGAQHFEREGFREGRLPFPGWSLLGNGA